jgi:ribonuclease HI
MPWIRRKLRDNIVFVRVNAEGRPITGRDGRVDIKYKPDAAAKVYRASMRNLAETGDAVDDQPIELPEPEPEPGGGAAAGGPVVMTKDTIIIYTDGACTGNPGPAGIGAVILDNGTRRELSEYLGQGTNNIAELVAIERALQEVQEHRARPVVVHSDSSYSIGLLTKNWKAKANAELVLRLRQLVSRFVQLRFVKVKGHSGDPENERCDELARRAITRSR